MSEVAMAAAITVSVVGVSYVAFKPDAMTEAAEAVAAQATCRAVDQAILAYVAQHDTVPRDVADVRPYVDGDVSAYRIVRGRAAGPGCD